MAFTRSLGFACLLLAFACAEKVNSLESTGTGKAGIHPSSRRLHGRAKVTLPKLFNAKKPALKKEEANNKMPKLRKLLLSKNGHHQKQQESEKKLQELKFHERELEEAKKKQKLDEKKLMEDDLKKQETKLEKQRKLHEKQRKIKERWEAKMVAAHKEERKAMHQKHQQPTDRTEKTQPETATHPQHMQPLKHEEHKHLSKHFQQLSLKDLQHTQPSKHEDHKLSSKHSQHTQPSKHQSGSALAGKSHNFRRHAHYTSLLQTAENKTVVAALDSAYAEVTSLLATPPSASHMAADDHMMKTQKKKGGQMPVQEHVPLDKVRSILKDLSPECSEQFENMMEGKGRAKKLHLFGTSQYGATEEACSDLGGVVCQNHATIRQTQVAADSRRLVVDSKVDGKSCLPRKCVGEADIKTLATFVQGIAVKAVGPASQGQKPSQVMLSVDCSESGGGKYAAQSQWSKEEAGAGDPEPMHRVHSDAKRHGLAAIFVLAITCLVV